MRKILHVADSKEAGKEKMLLEPNLKILFVSHMANRTGAPLSLLTFQKWLKRNSNVEFSTWLGAGGVLLEEYRKEGATELYSSDLPLSRNLFFRTLQQKGSSFFDNYVRQKILLRKIKKQNFDVIYSNTISNHNVLEALKVLDIPVVTHVRELEKIIENYGGTRQMRKLDILTSRFVVGSDVVKQNLISNHQVVQEKISKVNNFISLSELTPVQKPKKDLKKKLGIPEDCFIVGGCGQTRYDKGFDLFIQLAVQLKKKDSKYFFLWIGPNKPSTKKDIEYDLYHADLSESVRFAGSVENPLDFISLFDVFAMVSREEGFGNVGLEAAQFRIPTVCFSGVTGFSEFTVDEAGVAVPYLDVMAMTNEIEKLKKDKAYCKRIGDNAYAKLEDYDVEKQSPKLLEILRKVAYQNKHFKKN